MTQTKQSPRKRPHWLKYTGRQEIEQALTERQQDRWRREQRPRRLLVLAMALVAVALALSSFIAHDDVRLPSVVLLWLVVIVLYFKLLNSVRQVPYAPDDLLDERQLALRDNTRELDVDALPVVEGAQRLPRRTVAADDIAEPDLLQRHAGFHRRAGLGLLHLLL
jgi:hypothetical protein